MEITLKPLIVSSHALYDLIIQPNFADIVGDYTGSYSGVLSEFRVIDNVSLVKGTPLIDLFAKGNILKRKDRSCLTDWSSIARGSNRRITVDELYGAVQNCEEEFYDGCLKDFRDKNPMFKTIVLDFFKKLLSLDIAVNSYFGDVTRLSDTDPLNPVSWNAYDGIFTKYAYYITNGTIPAGQTGTIATGAISAANAYALLQNMYSKQDNILKMQANSDKAFYVNKGIADAYEDYLISTGANSCCGVQYIQNGIPTISFKGIPIFVEPLWDTILYKLEGAIAHTAVLTLRQNWAFGTNKSYGGGANLNQGLRIWYSEDDEVWRYKSHLVAGTEIVAPQHTVIFISA